MPATTLHSGGGPGGSLTNVIEPIPGIHSMGPDAQRSADFFDQHPGFDPTIGKTTPFGTKINCTRTAPRSDLFE